jgi:hypothetical protein
VKNHSTDDSCTYWSVSEKGALQPCGKCSTCHEQGKGDGTDYLGDPLPAGFRPWSCHVCTAVCNFEAMMQCAKRFDPKSECGFDRDQPESNHKIFAFIVPTRKT